MNCGWSPAESIPFAASIPNAGSSDCDSRRSRQDSRMRARKRITAVTLFLLAGCAATTTASYLQERQGAYRITAGYVIELKDLQDPDVHKLKGGVAYTVTGKGAFLVMEFRRGRRERFDLEPGDVFVQGRPLSYLLKRIPGAGAQRK